MPHVTWAARLSRFWPTLVALEVGCQSPSPDRSPDVGAAEAHAIAAGFVEIEARNRPEWRVAEVDDLVTYFDSAGEVQAYEIRVRDASDQPAGWVMVEAWEEMGPLSAFATAGETNFDRLVALYRARGGEAALDAMSPLWVGPGSSSMDVRETGGSIVRVAPVPELEHLVYDGHLRREQQRQRPADPEDDVPASEQRRELRTRYAAGDFAPDLMGAKPISIDDDNPVAHIAIGGGAGAFAHYKQELGNWSSANSVTYCYTGCVPVAFAILLEYWDRRGFPSLIGNVDDNANSSHLDPDVVWTLDRLRVHLRTRCDAYGGNGSTLAVFDAVRAVDHVNTRDAGTWRADNDVAFNWDSLRGEIDAGRPAVIHYDHTEQNGVDGLHHAAVAYEYTDNSGSANDWICAEKGWFTQGITWHCFRRTTVGQYQVTRMIPPSLTPPATISASDGQFTDRVRITWSPVAGASYTVNRSSSPSGYGVTIASGLTGTSFDDTTAPLGTHYYWVRSASQNQTSKFSVHDVGSRANASTQVRVSVAGLAPGAGQYVCVSAWGYSTRRADPVGGRHESLFSLSALPANLDHVFWVSTSQTCDGGWVRDAWPASNAYAVNGVTVNRCVPRPDFPQWSYVRASVNAGGAVANSGTAECPGGQGGPERVNALETGSA